MEIKVLLFAIFVILLVTYLNHHTREASERRQAAPAARPRQSQQFNVIADPDYFCRIAGAAYRCCEADEGGFTGTVRPDPGNAHDRNAMAVVRADGWLMGYVPADELALYCEWAGGRTLPCVGYVRIGESGRAYGKVKVIDDRFGADFVTCEILGFVRWMVSKFGSGFVPGTLAVNGRERPSTDEEWISYLSEEMAKMEDGDEPQKNRN